MQSNILKMVVVLSFACLMSGCGPAPDTRVTDLERRVELLESRLSDMYAVKEIDSHNAVEPVDHSQVSRIPTPSRAIVPLAAADLPAGHQISEADIVMSPMTRVELQERA